MIKNVRNNLIMSKHVFVLFGCITSFYSINCIKFAIYFAIYSIYFMHAYG